MGALEKVCSLVGKDISAECDALVENYGDDLVKFIIAEITSGEICKKLGLCMLEKEVPKLDNQNRDDEMEEIIRKLQELQEQQELVAIEQQEAMAALDRQNADLKDNSVEVSSDVSCDVCTFFATELDKLVSTNSTKEEIKDALEKACNILPSKSFVVECNALVDTYIDQIIEEIESGLSPKNICGASGLGLCTSSLELTQVQANPVCALCGLVMVQLVQQLEDGSTQAQVIAALDQVCKSVPLDPFADDCVVFVEKEAPEIISQIAKGIHPSEICQELRLCPATVQEDREVQKEKEIEAVEGKIVCELCSVVTHELDQLIQEDSTQDEIEAALDKVCSLLPADYVGQCD